MSLAPDQRVLLSNALGRRAMLTAWLGCIALCAQSGVQAPVDGFTGNWSTSFGPLELVVAGGRVEGHYVIEGRPGELRGEVEGGRLRHRYFGPGSDGEGWFELQKDGELLEGRWRPHGGRAWFPWNGIRTTAVDGLPVLALGQEIEGVIHESDPLVTSNGLLPYGLEALVRGRTVRLVVPEAGPYYVDLRSTEFDAYLVLRDVEGNVLSEDDDGLFGTHSRLAASLEARSTYLLDVCALYGGSGPFEVVLGSGRPPDISPEELRRAEIEQAEAAVRRAEDRWGPEHPATAASLHELALLLGRQHGRLKESRSLFERALRIREQALGSEHLATAESLFSMAGLLHEQGLLEESRPLAERAIAVQEAILGPDHPEVAGPLLLLGSILGQQGVMDEADVLLDRAFRICEEGLGPDHPKTAFVSNIRGLFYWKQGRLEEALDSAEKASRVWAKMEGYEYERAQGVHSLALVLESLGRVEEARSRHEESLRLVESLGPEHHHVASALHALAGLAYRQGAFEEARHRFAEALRISLKALGSEHPSTAQIRFDMACLLADTGELESAFELCRVAIGATETRSRKSLSGLTESERLRYAGEIRATLELFLSLAPLVLETGEAEQESYERLLGWKGRISRSLLADEPARTEEETALLAKLQDAQARLSNEIYRTDVASDPARERLLEELRKERNALELDLVRVRTSSRPPDSTQPEETSLSTLAERLPPRSVAVDFYVHRVYRPAVRTEEGIEEAASWSAPRLTAWVISRWTEGVSQFDLGEAGAIEAATRDFLTALVGAGGQRGLGVAPEEGRTDERSRAARKLRQALWDPLQGAIGEAELVLVSPDTFLGALPFETLPLEDGTRLVEHHAFVYLSDMASLPRLEEPAQAGEGGPSPLLLAGDIDYGERDALPEGFLLGTASRGNDVGRRADQRGWAPLPATRDESDAIVSIHEQAFGEKERRIVLTRGAAHEERIKLEMPGCRYVHLATHGYFHPEGLPSMWKRVQELRAEGSSRPGLGMEHQITGLLPGLLSGIVLSGANGEPEAGRENGLLTAEEVTYFDLSRCELVVLSACETGMGRPESGEGILGLRRSFLQAGARTVVSSLWAVGDEPTSELMQDFYENLWLKGMGRLEALRSAQLGMLARNRRAHGDAAPSTWGAFVLSGEWR